MSQNGYEIENGFDWRRSVNLFTTTLVEYKAQIAPSNKLNLNQTRWKFQNLLLQI